jgi:membrane protein DedA with SNARE-associated domain
VLHWFETLLRDYGLIVLFVVVALESFGLPVPGETLLLVSAVLSSQGKFAAIEWVIVVTAAAAIVGDNGGYWAGREGGRKLLYRWEWLGRFADRVLPRAERFFKRHGGKSVFLARFLAGLRVTGAWMAGISRMDWWTFLFWNAAGGIVWATGYGLVAYFLGDAAKHAIERYGLWAAAVLVALVVVGFLAVHFGKRELEERL